MQVQDPRRIRLKIGIEVTQEDGFCPRHHPDGRYPAMEAGVEAGDFITHVDGGGAAGF